MLGTCASPCCQGRDQRRDPACTWRGEDAAAVRQIIFENQRGYTYDELSVPPRISDIRSVIQDIDADLGAVLGV